jgi:hypothetical protein
MKGYPKHLNSKADYEYVLEHFPEQGKKAYQELLDTQKDWLSVGKIAEVVDGKPVEAPIGEAEPLESGVEDATHKVVNSESADKTESYQYEYKVDPNCRMSQLGMTEEEVRMAVSE